MLKGCVVRERLRTPILYCGGKPLFYTVGTHDLDSPVATSYMVTTPYNILYWLRQHLHNQDGFSLFKYKAENLALRHVSEHRISLTKQLGMQGWSGTKAFDTNKRLGTTKSMSK